MRLVLLATLPAVVVGCAQIPPADVVAPQSPGRKVAVFDIDGTLTPQNLYVFEARPGAASVVAAFKDKGYAIVYITTRVPLYQSPLIGWLRDNGFPQGTLHVAQTKDERDHPSAFKRAMLQRYTTAGWQLAYAYGDSDTDFSAYAAAGIDSSHVFALKRRFASTCEPGVYQACLDSWLTHMTYIDSAVPRAQ